MGLVTDCEKLLPCCQEDVMNIERYLRLIAGVVVMTTLALGYWVHPAWFLFTAFVGLNLFQSAFTNWCPMMSLLKWLHVPACSALGSARIRASK
jgi:hypothetical protein